MQYKVYDPADLKVYSKFINKLFGYNLGEVMTKEPYCNG